MTALRSFHNDHGATYVDCGGQEVPDHFGRPERTHLAVRNGVGVTEQPADIVVVTGDDRVDYVDNVVTNSVSAEPGSGCHALVLTPKGRIYLDMYVYTGTDRLLLILPPGTAADLLEEWREKVFIQDVTFEDASEDYAILGVHGPRATEKLASVVSNVGIPEGPFQFVQATLADAGVTIIPTDAPCGEESFDVVCASYDAAVVIDALLTRGYNAVPFGRTTWETLTLEAGTLLFEDVVGSIPNVVGLRSALDFEKGCFVGQEVVSRIENLGEQNNVVFGLETDRVAPAESAVLAGDDSIGEVLRGVHSPVLERPIALAIGERDHPDEVTVRIDGEEVGARVRTLPFVEGSAKSLRLPAY